MFVLSPSLSKTVYRILYFDIDQDQIAFAAAVSMSVLGPSKFLKHFPSLMCLNSVESLGYGDG